jgi:SSS family solute:Na+ symporter
VTSLAVKVGALLVILLMPTQFALDLQLLGGIWILQTLPALVFGLYTNWFRAPAMRSGWAVGFFGGTYLVWINGLKPLQAISLGGEPFTVYIGLLALIANIIVAFAANLVTARRAVAA